MEYKIFKTDKFFKEEIGYYDEEFIYDSTDRKLFKYHDGKIERIDYISTTVAYYKDGVLYDNMLLSNVVANYSNQKVYKGMWSNEMVGSYEGSNGYCAAVLLLLKKSNISKNQESINNKEQSSSIGVGEPAGTLSGLFGGAIGGIIGIIVLLAIIYAILNAASYFWGGTLSNITSLPMLFEYIRSGSLDADAISNIAIVLLSILSAVWIIFHNDDISEKLTELILDSYGFIYKISIPICIVITLLLDFKISSIFGIAFAGAIVVIFPAVIAGCIRFTKQKRN